MKIFYYLDELVNFGANSSVTDPSQHMTLELATKVGFIINVEKSSLSPTTQPEFLGAKIEISNLAARPADRRIGKTISVGQKLRSRDQSKAKTWPTFPRDSSKAWWTLCRMHMKLLQIHDLPNRTILAPEAMVYLSDQLADRQSKFTPSEKGPVEATRSERVPANTKCY